MVETHPFGNFVPQQAKFLLLGSFTTKPTEGYEWFYANKRNQFWPIMEEVYGLTLDTKDRQQQLFTKLHLGVGDIIYQCERERGSHMDNNLVNIVYNIEPIKKILQENKIEKVYFSSRFVENKFKRVFKEIIAKFPEIELITLPSPSPRYAAMRKEEKVERYKELLPKL